MIDREIVITFPDALCTLETRLKWDKLQSWRVQRSATTTTTIKEAPKKGEESNIIRPSLAILIPNIAQLFYRKGALPAL